jgi:hypothetical protein
MKSYEDILQSFPHTENTHIHRHTSRIALTIHKLFLFSKYHRDIFVMCLVFISYVESSERGAGCRAHFRGDRRLPCPPPNHLLPLLQRQV